MKFKFDPIVAVGFGMALVLLHNALLYGGDILAASGIVAAAAEWVAIIALFGLGIWAMMDKTNPKILPAHHEAVKGIPQEKRIEG